MSNADSPRPDVAWSDRREAVRAVIRLLPGSVQSYLVELFRASESDPSREHELFTSLRSTLNTLAREGALPRRAFLQIAGLVVTGGLVPFLCPEKAHAWQTWTGFWQNMYSNPAAIYTGTDPYWDYVGLLLQFDGANGSTVFADESNVGKAPTINGTPYIDTSSSPFSGGKGSAKFNGSTDYLSFASNSDFEFGSSDFTVEWWEYRTSGNSSQASINRDPSQSGVTPFMFGYYNSGSLLVYMSSNGSSWDIASAKSLGSCSLNTWVHLAVCRQGNTFYCFKNGTQTDSWTSSGSVWANSNALGIAFSQTSFYFPGYLADLRIYKGIAKYGSNFTTRTTPIGLGSANDPYWGYCVLACPFENALKDMSGRRVSLYGSTAVSTAYKKYGTGSGSFRKATSDYAQLSSSALDELGDASTPCTIEAWVYPVSPTDNGTAWYSSTLISKGTIYSSVTIDSSGRLNFYLYAQNATGSVVQSSTGAVVSNQWSHIAVVLTSDVRLYVNGSLVASGTRNAMHSSGVGATLKLGVGDTGAATSFFDGYIDSLRITKGYARYTANFTPPTAAFPVGKDESSDPFWNSTTFLLQPSSGETTPIDLTGRHTLTRQGDAAISSTSLFSGKGSVAFDGTGDYLTSASSSDWSFGSGNFTWEVWAKTANPASDVYYLEWPTSGGHFALNVYSSGWRVGDFGTTDVRVSGTASLSASGWYHLAACRSGSTLYFYVNGALFGTANVSSTTFTSSGSFFIGAYMTGAQSFFSGNIASVRITKGVARYAQNFTPPTRAFATSTASWASYVTSGLVAYLDAGDSGSYLATSSSNLLSASEQFSNTDWVTEGTSVIANSQQAPDGTTTADTLRESAVSGEHRLAHVALGGLTANAVYTVSVFVKRETGSRHLIIFHYLAGTGNGAYATFDLTSGGVGTAGTALTGSGASATIQSVGNGWYRCTLTSSPATSSGAHDVRYGLAATTIASNSNRSGDGTSGLYLWGAQLEAGSQATSYVRTSTTTTNLLTYSEQADNAAWQNISITVSANSATAPDGSSNADKIVEDTSLANHILRQYSGSFSSGATVTYSAYVKAAGRSALYLRIINAGNGAQAFFDLSAGTVSSTYTLGTGTNPFSKISSVGNGWYRVSITATTPSITQINADILILLDVNTWNYTGDGSSGLYVWGAQLEVGSDATAYIPTTSASASRLSGTQVWRNLINQPADGSGAGAYDFYLGASSSSESSDPTFVGVAGGLSANDYFSLDGGDYFTLNGSNTTFLNSLHKSGAAFTIVMVDQGVGSSDCYFGTAPNSASTEGICYTAESNQRLWVSNGSSLPVNTNCSGSWARSPGWNFHAVAVNAGAGTALFYLNGSSVSKSISYSGASSGSSLAAKIASAGNGGNQCFSSGARVGSFMIYNRALSSSELDTIFTALRGRFGI